MDRHKVRKKKKSCDYIFFSNPTGLSKLVDFDSKTTSDRLNFCVIIVTLSSEHLQKSAKSNDSIKSYICFMIAPAKKKKKMRTALLLAIRSKKNSNSWPIP